MTSSNLCWLEKLAEVLEAPLTDREQSLIDSELRRIAGELRRSQADSPTSGQHAASTENPDGTLSDKP